MKTTVAELLSEFAAEYDRMVRDPLFAFYGGMASPAGRKQYIARRVQEIRHYNRDSRFWQDALSGVEGS